VHICAEWLRAEKSARYGTQPVLLHDAFKRNISYDRRPSILHWLNHVATGPSSQLNHSETHHYRLERRQDGIDDDNFVPPQQLIQLQRSNRSRFTSQHARGVAAATSQYVYR